MTQVKGLYVQIFVPEPLYDHLADVAERKSVGVATLVREIVIGSAPPSVQRDTRPLLKHAAPPAPADFDNDIVLTGGRPKAVLRYEKRALTHEQLVDRHRAEVLRLAARPWTDNTIATYLRIPYKVVQEITASARKKKRRGRT